MDINSVSFETYDPFTLERLFDQNDIKSGYSVFNLKFSQKSKYYNKNIYLHEPFIEKFTFIMESEQEKPMSEMKTHYRCSDIININFTYGLTSTLQRAIKNLYIYEKLNQDQDIL